MSFVIAPRFFFAYDCIRSSSNSFPRTKDDFPRSPENKRLTSPGWDLDSGEEKELWICSTWVLEMAANFRPTRPVKRPCIMLNEFLSVQCHGRPAFQFDELHTLTSCHPPHRDRSTNHSLAHSDLLVLSALWRSQYSKSLLVLRVLLVDTYCRTAKLEVISIRSWSCFLASFES